MNAPWRSNRRNMFEVLASLLLILLLNCRTCAGTIGAGSPPPPPSWQPEALAQQDVNCVNDLIGRAPKNFNGTVSTTDCTSKTILSFLKCQCDKSTNICRVTDILFSDRGLSGPIPAAIGSLTYLKSLDLSANKLSGSIPESFRNLSQLSEIYLDSNILEGPIPHFLSEMKSLKTIDLSANKLSGLIPESFRNLSQLSEIYLESNILEGSIPHFLSEMKSLKTISLMDNFFNGSIPREYGTFPVLENLYLDDNFLSNGIPDELGNLSSLRILSLTDNELSGQLPQQLGNLSYLEKLYLENNLFSGELPPSFEKLKSLILFIVRGNNFSGKIPASISKWKNLLNLDLSGNNFEGPIPDAISNFTNLIFLCINDLVGEQQHYFPELQNISSIQYLSLRNCSLTGSIPEYIWQFKSMTYLDLSFNSLVGGIPPIVNVQPEIIFLRRNNLNESLPEWLTKLKDSYVDVSENSFTNAIIPREAMSSVSPKKNYFACCSKINNEDMKWLEANYACANNSHTYEHLYINCGGDKVNLNGYDYEADLEPDGGSTFYLSRNQAWAFSSMGIFQEADNQQYILNKTCNISVVDAPLYVNARVSPISLKYYAFCLKNQHYTVRLHFAEIGWDTTRDPSMKRNRVFDVEIQGEKKLADFNIEEEAGGVNRNTTREYNVTVHDNRLEIHLYWSGKGSTIARTRYYGPLISAISVSPVLQEHHKLSSTSIIGIVGSALLVVILILALFWKLGWLGGKTNKSEEQKGIELFPGGIFSFRQIKAATKNFDPENKIGEGGFGFVYKGVLPNGTRIAVKKLSTKSKQGAREFINEIGTNYTLQHPNLVRILGCCNEQNELLLVYEYMENNSLEHALFGSSEVKSRLNWLIRVKICHDVAKGLAFLHEECKLKITHRDIQPTNILLDKDFTAKISDFGFAQHNEEENSHSIKRITGTTGYMAPEYLQGFLTPKVDVYSFGIVTLEIVSGKNISTFRPKDQNVYLLDTAYVYQQQGNLIALIDPSLGTEYTYNDALKILNLAMDCVSPAPKLRPSMSEVVKVLDGIVKAVEAKWKTKTKSPGNLTSADAAAMANPQFAFSQSTQSAGSTSQEGASDTIICPSTSKEIDDSSNFDD